MTIVKMKNYKVRFPNEIHATDYPLNWKEFEATNVLDKEVFGRYGSQTVAVRRKDYDKYLLKSIIKVNK